MRTFANIILISLIVPVFVIGLAAAIIRFQLLTPIFWEKTFQKNQIYQDIADTVKKSVENQTAAEKGGAGDVKFITDLLTAQNVRDFVDKNIGNLLLYANGRSQELMVYIPLKILPKGFLPKNFEILQEDQPLTTLLAKLNIGGITPGQIRYISLLGRSSTYLLVLDLSLLTIILIFLYLLTPSKSRFTAIGTALVLSGLTTIVIYFVGVQISSQIIGLTTQKTAIELIFGTIAPAVILEIIKSWLVIGIVATIIGIGLFFLRKPEYNKPK